MSRYRVEMSRAVRETITHLPPELTQRVKNALRSLAKDPYEAKELKEELVGLRSYRIGRSRLILRIARTAVEIVAFGPRSAIYERAAAELSARLRRERKE